MIKSQSYRIPDGDNGTKATLELMKKMIETGKKDVNNIQLARQITQRLPEKDKVGEARALFDFVRKNVRYVNDIRGVELLQDAEVTLRRLGSGDCDDHTIALGTLLEIVGTPTRIVAMKPVGADWYTHVYLDALLNDTWVHMDPIEKVQKMGWEYPTIKEKLVLPVSMDIKEMQMYDTLIPKNEWSKTNGLGDFNTEFKNIATSPITLSILAILFVGGIGYYLHKKGKI